MLNYKLYLICSKHIEVFEGISGTSPWTLKGIRQQVYRMSVRGSCKEWVSNWVLDLEGLLACVLVSHKDGNPVSSHSRETLKRGSGRGWSKYQRPHKRMSCARVVHAMFPRNQQECRRSWRRIWEKLPQGLCNSRARRLTLLSLIS